MLDEAGFERRKAEMQREREQGYPQPDPATQPAPMPEDEERSILLKHVVNASREIEERRQLTANQRETEKLDSELGTITQQLHQALAHPVENRRQIAELKQKLEAAESRYGELTGKKIVDKTVRLSKQTGIFG